MTGTNSNTSDPRPRKPARWLRNLGVNAARYARQVESTAQSMFAGALPMHNMFTPTPTNPLLGVKMPSAETIVLNPLMRRRSFSVDGTGLPFDRVGWVQMPGLRRFALGYFTSHGRFGTLAMADDTGAVYMTGDLYANLDVREPDLELDVTDSLVTDDDSRFGGTKPAHIATVEGSARALVGDIQGRDGNGRMAWLAGFLKSANRYTIENARAELPARLRTDLEYRDLMAVCFFHLYLAVSVNGGLQGYGAGNIISNFRRFSPLAAIRTSVAQTDTARAHRMRVSGLEEYFADTMRRIGVMGDLSELEANHGREPLYMIESSVSHARFLIWEKRMPYDAMLTSLKLEGAVNRFLLIDKWLDYNAAHSEQPIEDTVTSKQVARIDRRLLRNPSLSALPPTHPVHILDDPECFRVDDYLHFGRGMSLSASLDASQAGVAVDVRHLAGSEWIYRHALANAVNALWLPFRFDTDFRSNLQQGEVSFAFTSASRTLMPDELINMRSGAMTELDEAERSRISAEYNLQIGLIFASLAFGASEQVRCVSLRMDSLGLEEAVYERDNAIKTLMDNAMTQISDLTNLEDFTAHAGQGRFGERGSALFSDPEETSGVGDDEHDGVQTQAMQADTDFDRELRDLLEHDGSTSSDETTMHHAESEDDTVQSLLNVDEEFDRLRNSNPSIKHLLTVTFTRDEFIDYMHANSCADPFAVYDAFGAQYDYDGTEGFRPVEPSFSMDETRFTGDAAYTIPERRDRPLDATVARSLGAHNVRDLSISREELFRGTLELIADTAKNDNLRADRKATYAMNLIEECGDPELRGHATEITTAIIDGTPIPQITSTVERALADARRKSQEMVFSGDEEGAIVNMERVIGELDEMFESDGVVPHYFTSYTDRVVYNRLFAMPDERIALVPDALFQAHLDMGEVLFRYDRGEEAMTHLNTLVRYAPATAGVHIQQAIRLCASEDWNSVRAAALNALRVACDPVDAANAYYYFACASWMKGDTAVAVAAGNLATSLTQNLAPAQRAELERFRNLAMAQGEQIAQTGAQAVGVLMRHDVPVWPQVECAQIIRDAAFTATNEKIFPVAQALNVSWYALQGGNLGPGGMQFLRSLNA